MAEQRVVVVSEVAPKLTVFDGPAARKFLRDYVAYENRLDATEAQVPLRRCLEPNDLETLLDCSEDLRIEVVREPAAAQLLRRNLQLLLQRGERGEDCRGAISRLLCETWSWRPKILRMPECPLLKVAPTLLTQVASTRKWP